MEEKSTLKTILTLGGIFVGGFLLYKFFFVPTPRRGGGGTGGTGTGDGTGTGGTGTGDGTGTGARAKTMFETFMPASGDEVELTETTIKKKNTTAGMGSAWNARAFSKAGTSKSCTITASPTSTGGTMMFGLVTDPIGRSVRSWSTMDYAFYFYGESSPKRIEIWENGKNQNVTITGDYKPTDKFTVKYDAPTKTISYLINGVEKKKTVVTAVKPLFGLATVYNGAGFKDLVLTEATASFASADGGMSFFAPPGF